MSSPTMPLLLLGWVATKMPFVSTEEALTISELLAASLLRTVSAWVPVNPTYESFWHADLKSLSSDAS